MELKKIHKSVNTTVLRIPSRYHSYIIKAVAAGLALALWQWYAVPRPPYLFPTLEQIASAFVEQYHDYQLVPRFFGSLITLFAGFGLATVVGIVAGLGMGLDKRLAVMLEPYVNAFYTAPITATVPFLVVIGGATFQTRVFIVFILSVFEILIDTYEGVKTTPSGFLDAAASFGATRWFTIRHIIIPHDIPYMIAGLRLGIGRGIKGMILAEILIEFANMGAILRTWQNEYRIAGVLSIVVVLMLLGLVLTRAITLLGDHLLQWREDGSGL